MRLIPLVLSLAVTLAAAAEAPTKEWLEKGDVVYVSADLVLHVSDLFTMSESAVPRCSPLIITKVDYPKQRVRLMPAGGSKRMLIQLWGPWYDRIHRDAERCEDDFRRRDPPTVIRTYTVHQIVPPPE